MIHSLYSIGHIYEQLYLFLSQVFLMKQLFPCGGMTGKGWMFTIKFYAGVSKSQLRLGLFSLYLTVEVSKFTGLQLQFL